LRGVGSFASSPGFAARGFVSVAPSTPLPSFIDRAAIGGDFFAVFPLCNPVKSRECTSVKVEHWSAPGFPFPIFFPRRFLFFFLSGRFCRPEPNPMIQPIYIFLSPRVVSLSSLKQVELGCPSTSTGNEKNTKRRTTSPE